MKNRTENLFAFFFSSFVPSRFESVLRLGSLLLLLLLALSLSLSLSLSPLSLSPRGKIGSDLLRESRNGGKTLSSLLFFKQKKATPRPARGEGGKQEKGLRPFFSFPPLAPRELEEAKQKGTKERVVAFSHGKGKKVVF